MSSIVIESFDSAVHRNYMPEIMSPINAKFVLIVRVSKFQLEFLSKAQLEAAINYFGAPSKSTRIYVNGGDHWEFQPWYCRLPKGINNARNCSKVLEVLVAARSLANVNLL